jgi:hypothetical protein
MRRALFALLPLLVVIARPARAQQFNSDNHLSRPVGSVGVGKQET